MTEEIHNEGKFQPKSDPVPFKEKMSYAMGNFPGGIYSGVMGQINTFYYAWMLLKWEWIVIGQIIYGIWNAINDPIFGQLQDRTKRKEGRYLPWIKCFAPLFSISFLIVFIPPDLLRSKAEIPLFSMEQISLFLYYIISQVFYDTMYTIIYIAWVALLPQMTMEEGERTKISALSAITAALGMGIAAITMGNLIDPDLERIRIFQILVSILSVITFIPWIFVYKNCKERLEFIPEEETSLIDNFKCVFNNPAGRIYAYNEGILQGIFFFLTTGITFAITWLLGLNENYQNVRPGWDIIDVLPYLLPAILGFIIGIIILAKIAEKKDIKSTLMFHLIAEAIGFTIAFLGFLPTFNVADPNTPIISNNLWLASIGLFIGMMGLPGYFLYQNPMRADTIDYDEYLTGERRESVYAGIACIFGKPMQSVGLAAVPAIIGLFGLVGTPDSSPINTTLYPKFGYPMALTGVAVATFLFPAILAAIGILIWRKYPLDRKALLELRKNLEKIHSEKKQKRLNEDGSSKFCK